MSATAQERLQEAALFYKSLPDNEKSAGMTEYLRERFDLTDPVDVKHSILKIRKHLARQGTWEYEAARLEQEMLRLCFEHSDIPIHVSISEQAENLTEDVVEYFSEEYTMAFSIGTRVRLAALDIAKNAGNTSLIPYGVVCANELAYVTNVNPFDEAGMHDYKTYRPKRENFASEQEYSEVLTAYNTNEVSRQARILATAELVCVLWCDRSGKEVGKGWALADSLRELTAEDEAALQGEVTS